MLAVARAVEALNRETAVHGTPALNGGLLVLDEVTSYLLEDDSRRVLDTFRRTTELGFGVLFVTHRLEEVFAIANWVTVLRDGAVMRSCAVKDVTRSSLVGLMIGRVVDEGRLSAPALGSRGEVQGAVAEVSDLSCDRVKDVSFAVRAGEIVGLTGLVASGFELIPYALFGAVPAQGVLTVGGKRLALRGLTPRRALEAGLALIPAGRLTRGAVGTATVAENMSLLAASRMWRRSFWGPHEEAIAVASLTNRFDIRPRNPHIELGRLSGGNQQKAIIAKWLTSAASLFMVHELTQGVDVGAKGEILRTIRSLGEAGKAVLVASADHGDLARVCDRVLVFRDGAIFSEISGAQLTEAHISAAAHGLSGAVA
jgi:ribose transport system ATP-binding protein